MAKARGRNGASGAAEAPPAVADLWAALEQQQAQIERLQGELSQQRAEKSSLAARLQTLEGSGRERRLSRAGLLKAAVAGLAAVAGAEAVGTTSAPEVAAMIPTVAESFQAQPDSGSATETAYAALNGSGGTPAYAAILSGQSLGPAVNVAGSGIGAQFIQGDAKPSMGTITNTISSQPFHGGLYAAGDIGSVQLGSRYGALLFQGTEDFSSVESFYYNTPSQYTGLVVQTETPTAGNFISSATGTVSLSNFGALNGYTFNSTYWGVIGNGGGGVSGEGGTYGVGSYSPWVSFFAQTEVGGVQAWFAPTSAAGPPGPTTQSPHSASAPRPPGHSTSTVKAAAGGPGYSLGMIYVDALGAIYHNIAAGNPGSWAPLYSVIPVTPTRIGDTRFNTGGLGTTPVGNGTKLTFTYNPSAGTFNGVAVPGVSGPIVGVVLILRVRDNTGAGYAVAYGGNGNPPTAATVNFFPISAAATGGQPLAFFNTAVVPVVQNQFSIYISETGSSTANVVIDLNAVQQ